MDWFDLLAVQGTLKSLLQHHSLKASFLQFSAFFMVQLSFFFYNTQVVYLWKYIWLVIVLSHSVVSDSLWPHGLLPAWLLCLWASPGEDTGAGCHFLLQSWNNCIPNPEMAGFPCVHRSGLLFSRCSFWCQDLLQISLAVTIWGLDI